MDCIPQHAAEHRAKAGHGVYQGEGMGIVVLGGCEEGEFQLLEERIIRGEEGQIDRHGLLHGGIVTALGPPVAMRFVGNLLADLGHVVVAIGMLPMGQECSAFAHQGGAAPAQVTGGAHLRWRDRGLREHPAPQHGGNLVRIDLVVCRFPAVEGFHGEGMPQDEGEAFLNPEVSEPGPGAETLDGHHATVSRGRNGREEGFRSRFPVAVQQDFTLLTHDTDVHGTGMQVDTAVKWVLGGGEAP